MALRRRRNSRSGPLKTLPFDDIQELGNGKPVDIAFIAVKSYDTERVTKAVKPYLAPDGYAVSLQNCINEDTIAAIVGADKTLGVIASIISVELYEAGRIRRMAAKGGDKHTVFRIGEVNGGVTDRVNELVTMFSLIDSTKATTNLFGERWSKLIQNGMRNGIAAATGLTSGECDRIGGAAAVCDQGRRRRRARGAGAGHQAGRSGRHGARTAGARERR